MKYKKYLLGALVYLIIPVIFIAMSPLFYSIEARVFEQYAQLRQDIFLTNLEKNPNVQKITKVAESTVGKDRDSDWAALSPILLLPKTIYYDITIETKDGYSIDLQRVSLKSIFDAGTRSVISIVNKPDFLLARIYKTNNAAEDYTLVANWRGESERKSRISSPEDIEIVLGKTMHGIDDLLEHYQELIVLYKEVEVQPNSTAYTIIRNDNRGHKTILTLERYLK